MSIDVVSPLCQRMIEDIAGGKSAGFRLPLSGGRNVGRRRQLRPLPEEQAEPGEMKSAKKNRVEQPFKFRQIRKAFGARLKKKGAF